LAKKRHTTNNHGLKRFNWQRIHSTNLITKCDQAIYKHLSHQDKENAPKKLATMLEPVSDSLTENTSNTVPPESS
uniref:hypothetical protein n=1 Tax=Vibrio kanaloae TaxID=170673 RepID=UPI0019D14B7D